MSLSCLTAMMATIGSTAPLWTRPISEVAADYPRAYQTLLRGAQSRIERIRKDR